MSSASERRELPYSVECEQSVLGALLLRNDSYDQIPWLSAGAFYQEQPRLIFRAIVRLLDAGREADMLTVAHELGADLEKAGGIAYLGALVQGTPSAYNIKHYAEIVRDKAILRQLAQSASDIAAMCSASMQDPHALAERAEQMISAVIESEVTGEVDYPKLLMQAVDRAEAARAQDTLPGLRTGLADLDDRLGGLRPGNLIILAGRPGTGKTSLATCLAEQISARHPVAFFTLEMDRDELADRLLSLASDVPLEAIRCGSLTEEQLDHVAKTATQMADRKLLLDDLSGIGLGYLRARCRRWKRKHGLGLVVVDYLQLMRGTGDNREQEVSSISRGLKSLAKEMRTPVIALCQLNREIEKRVDKRPQLSDLRESGAIEQDADIVLMVHRDDVREEETPNAGLAQAFIRKHRNGALGVVTLRYRAELCRFESTDERFTGAVSQLRPVTKFKVTRPGADFKSRAAADDTGQR